MQMNRVQADLIGKLRRRGNSDRRIVELMDGRFGPGWSEIVVAHHPMRQRGYTASCVLPLVAEKVIESGEVVLK
jgi:hypothetical protein